MSVVDAVETGEGAVREGVSPGPPESRRGWRAYGLAEERFRLCEWMVDDLERLVGRAQVGEAVEGCCLGRLALLERADGVKGRRAWQACGRAACTAVARWMALGGHVALRAEALREEAERQKRERRERREREQLRRRTAAEVADATARGAPGPLRH